MVDERSAGAVIFYSETDSAEPEFLLLHYTAGHWDFPKGNIEHGEQEIQAAIREIREETGMEAGNLQKVGEFYLAPGYSTEFMAVFLATDLKENPLDADDDEFLQVEKISLKKALEMAEQGDVPDAKSLAALLLARPYLEKYTKA